MFARERVRRAVARLVTPGMERSVYTWAASVLLIAVCALWRPLHGIAWEAEGALKWLLWATQLGGVWLTLVSAAKIDVLELSGVRQLTSPIPPVRFRTSGPYGWVRHPIYSGWFLMVLGAPTMTMTRLLFAGLSCTYLLVAIPLEEATLRDTTGGAYARYAAEVRWKLVPGLF